MRSIFFLGCALLVFATACSPGETADSSTTTTSTVLATTSTTLGETTTSSVPTTTTTTAATTTTLAVTTTTAAPGSLELSDEGIQAGDTWVPFGSDDDDAVAAVSAVVGDPFDDSGWLDSASEGWERFGVCPSPRVRGVSWGTGGDVSLQLLFTDADTDFWSGGVEHFFTFYYAGSSEPEGIETTEGVGIGSSIGDLKAAYGPANVDIDEAFFDPSLGFWSYDYEAWTGLWGYATGQSDGDTLTSINGGQGCGE